MLKGISRQIVELSNTDSPYFERAFFVVRANCTDLSPSRLDGEAKRMLLSQTPYTGIKQTKRRQRLYRYLLLLVGGIIGALTVLLLRL